MAGKWTSVRRVLPPLGQRVSVVVRRGPNGRQDYLTGELRKLERGVSFVDSARQLPFDGPVTHWAELPDETPSQDATVLTIHDQIVQLEKTAAELNAGRTPDLARAVKLVRAAARLKARLDKVTLARFRDVRPWVSIDHDLPDRDVPVLATDGENVYKAALVSLQDPKPHFVWILYDTDQEWTGEDAELRGITHWMPLPSAPEDRRP